ncbi:MAG: abortive infection system antitoxin AbiGi family protein [Tissierellia bacterium]|nr:abortive infection system antitoxin AbiGi family protein [Tissierellia bacterium]
MNGQRYYSNIYWHFTGSPDKINWHAVIKPSDILKQGEPKTDEHSVEILKNILSTRKLLASCSERIVEKLETEKFCCVCDIPFKDLINHARYYGKIAIGFSAEIVHRKFNPVFYIDYDKIPIPRDVAIPGDTIIDTNTVFRDDDSVMKLFEAIFNTESAGYPLARALDSTLGSLKSHLKITFFSDNAEETFYGEREWRCINDFTFSYENIEAIIAPQAFLVDIKKFLMSECNYLGEFPIIPFDFIEKA